VSRAEVHPASLVSRWHDLALEAPHEDLLWTEASGWVNRGAFDALTRSVAADLLGRGLSVGDRVVVSARSSLGSAVAQVACLRSGVILVPVNPTYADGEWAHILDDASPALVIVDKGEVAERIKRLRGDVPQLVLEATQPVASRASGPRLSVDPESIAMIVYTSGTTGRPKGAMLSHRNLLAGLNAIIEAWRWTPQDRLLLVLPTFHVHGLCLGVFGSFLSGGSLLLYPKFEPEEVVRAVAEQHATMFFGVPTIYHRLVQLPEVRAMAGLRLCVSGSAPLPPGIWEDFRQRTGQAILERYGMSETLMLTSNPLSGPRRPGRVGLPLPGVELRIDPNTQEVEVRGPSVFSGYWRRPDASQDAFRDRWFRTGDVGRRDEDGSLELLGRSRELIICGGLNVYPREVEEALMTLPEIEEAAVVGVPSEEWGEVVVAWLVPAEPNVRPTIQALEERLAGLLARFKIPKRYEYVDALPKNALGKVEKRRLHQTS
jgi:malonyl-CoA/methylmalonyl-CoA synthetase